MKDDFNQPADPSLIFKNFMNVGILFASLCTTFTCHVYKRHQKRATNALELKLQLVVSHYVGAGT